MSRARHDLGADSRLNTRRQLPQGNPQTPQASSPKAQACETDTDRAGRSPSIVLAETEQAFIAARDRHLAARADLLEVFGRLGLNGDSAIMLI